METKENKHFITYKYLAISGKPITSTTEKTRDELIVDFVQNGEMISITPIVEIDGVEFWNSNTQYGFHTRETWTKKVCPQLRRIYR